MGEADAELKQVLEDMHSKSQTMAVELEIWNLTSKAKTEIKHEDEEHRVQRMKIKWESWNTLTKRKDRLKRKL